jgi:type IV secretion system protein VirB3
VNKNAVFRGCTRPPMFLGVPYIPFFVGAGGVFLLAIYFHILLLVLEVPVILIMRMMAKRDEMIFRLLGLSFQFRFRARNKKEHGGVWVFSPNAYRKSQPGAKRSFSGPHIISGRLSGPVTKAASRKPTTA